MNLNNFTIKSQEAVQSAQQVATSNGHQLKGMVASQGGIL